MSVEAEGDGVLVVDIGDNLGRLFERAAGDVLASEELLGLFILVCSALTSCVSPAAMLVNNAK